MQQALTPAFYEAMTSLVQALNAMAVANPTLNAVPVNASTPDEANSRALPASPAGPALTAPNATVTTSPPAGGIAAVPAIEPLQIGENVAGTSSGPVATCGCSCHSNNLPSSTSSSSSWYAVTKGRRVGVYSSWAVVQDAVSGCRAAYRKFASYDEAASYFNEALENQVVAVI